MTRTGYWDDPLGALDSDDRSMSKAGMSCVRSFRWRALLDNDGDALHARAGSAASSHIGSAFANRRLRDTAKSTAAAGRTVPHRHRRWCHAGSLDRGSLRLQGSRRLKPGPVPPPAPDRGGSMGRPLRTALAVLLAAACLVAAGPASATSAASGSRSALTSGPESF